MDDGSGVVSCVDRWSIRMIIYFGFGLSICLATDRSDSPFRQLEGMTRLRRGLMKGTQIKIRNEELDSMTYP